MWQMSLPWYEFVVRGLLIYIFLMVVLRLTGRRQLGHLTPFDMVLLLVLSNTVQNAMNGGDNSIPGGILSASTVIAANFIVSQITFRNRRLAGWIEGRAVVLIHNGKLDDLARRRNMVTREELMTALRAGGCPCIENVRCAMLETTGEITVVARD